jgi:hypothetical protein
MGGCGRPADRAGGGFSSGKSGSMEPVLNVRQGSPDLGGLALSRSYGWMLLDPGQCK